MAHRFEPIPLRPPIPPVIRRLSYHHNQIIRLTIISCPCSATLPLYNSPFFDILSCASVRNPTGPVNKLYWHALAFRSSRSALFVVEFVSSLHPNTTHFDIFLHLSVRVIKHDSR